jgi:hypothetical protein
MGEMRNAYKIFNGKPEGKIPLIRPRRRWEKNIKLHLRETGFNVMDWINLAKDRNRKRAVVNTVITFGFHKMRGIS